MISVVSPVYNEAGALRELCSRVAAALEKIGELFEIVLVNDGSTDDSLQVIRQLVSEDRHIKGVNLSRNFGQQPALTAGIDLAAGDAVVLMDADLQDSPEDLPLLIEKWREGYEVVYAMREKRKENFLMRAAFRTFYRVQTYLANVRMPVDSGIFCLMDRKVVDSIKSLPEQNRYLPGLRAWVGFRQTGVPMERAERYDRRARVGLRGLVKLAIDGVIGFSSFPLRIATFMSLFVGMISLLVIFFILFHKFVTHKALPGWASTMGSTLILGALILFSLGLIGEYLARIYDEVKKRPLYIIREVITGDKKTGDGTGK